MGYNLQNSYFSYKANNKLDIKVDLTNLKLKVEKAVTLSYRYYKTKT
jgi:hypothetical protein